MQILADPNTLTSKKFNNGRILENMLVNNFSISFIVTNNLYVLDFELFLSIP
jgi:hypothetical protein